MRRRHADVDHRDVGLVRAHLAQEVLAVARLADDLEAGVLEQPHRAAAQQHRVVGDHDPHGSSARRTVPSPGGEATVKRPPKAVDAVGEPAQAGAGGRVGTAAAVVAHRHVEAVALAVDVDVGTGRLGVPGHVGERLGGDEVRGGLDGGGQPLLRHALQRDRHGDAAGEAHQRRLEPALGEHGGMDAARELAQLGCRRRQVRDRLVEQRARECGVGLELPACEPQRERQADEVLLRAVVEVALEPAPGVVARGDDPGARRAQLLLGRQPVGDLADVAEEHGRAAPLPASAVIVSSTGISCPSRRTAVISIRWSSSTGSPPAR